MKALARHGFLALCGVWMWLATTADLARAEDLRPGRPIQRQITAAETHVYRLELSAGGFLRLLLAQQGVDATVEVTAPGDGAAVAIDGPGRYGVRRLVIPVGVAGRYRVQVHSDISGHYRLTAEQLPAAAADAPLAAEQRLTEAAQLYHQGTAETRQQAVEIYRDVLSKWPSDCKRRAQALFTVGVLHRLLREPDDALANLRQALALWRAEGEMHLTAQALNEIGYVLRQRGGSREALTLYDQALELWRSLGDVYGEVQTLTNIGVSHGDLGDPRRARVFYDEALARAPAARAPQLEARILNNLGGTHYLLGEPHEALAQYQKALELNRQKDEWHLELAALTNVGAAFRTLGEFQDALDHYQKALDLARRHDDLRRQATLLNNIGLIYITLGEPSRALPYLQEALEQRRQVSDLRGEAVTLHNLGQAQDHLGHGEQAIRHYNLALERRRQVGDRRGEAFTLTHLGALHSARGDLVAAFDALRRALGLRREVGDASREASTLRHLAELHLVRGDPARALEVAQQALELQNRHHDRDARAITLQAMAQAQRQLGRLDDARQQLETGLDLIESLRSDVADPQLRASFLAAKRQTYQTYLDVLMDLHRRQPAAGWDQRALEASERARARGLLDLLNEARADIRRGVDPELDLRQRHLQQRLSAKASRQLRLTGTEQEAQATALELEMQELLTEIEAVEAEIRRRSPAYAALAESRPITTAAIQRLLAPHTVLLEYALGDERSYLWWVTSDSVATFQLPPRATLEQAARQVYESWRTLDIRGQDAEAAAAAALARQLLAPVADRLQEQRLVIVADGALHYLPFAALPDPRDGAPLLARHEIVSLPSASVLAVQRRMLAERAAAPRTAMIFADPIFSAEDPRLGGTAIVASSLRSTSLEGSTANRRPLFERLPASRREAEVIAGLLPTDEVSLALDGSANRELALSGELARYRLLHFATHGVLDSQHPQLSGLVFSLVDGERQPVDGFLRLQDVYDLQLAADLVVLSGCQTALGKELRGEGLVGLTRGFMYAGAARVIASLWRVQDRAALELMERFYRALLVERLPAAAALRSAQLGIWRESRFRDPYFWAVFVLQGDWR